MLQIVRDADRPERGLTSVHTTGGMRTGDCVAVGRTMLGWSLGLWRASSQPRRSRWCGRYSIDKYFGKRGENGVSVTNQGASAGSTRQLGDTTLPEADGLATRCDNFWALTAGFVALISPAGDVCPNGSCHRKEHPQIDLWRSAAGCHEFPSMFVR